MVARFVEASTTTYASYLIVNFPNDTALHKSVLNFTHAAMKRNALVASAINSIAQVVLICLKSDIKELKKLASESIKEFTLKDRMKIIDIPDFMEQISSCY